MTKSDMIRNVIRQHPSWCNDEVLGYLHQQGHRVRRGLVHLVRFHERKLQPSVATRIKDRLEQFTLTLEGDPASIVRRIKAVASEVGGLSKLSELCEVLS